jgi:Holliday junction resolvasome RuvABC DNA-binding subunit
MTTPSFYRWLASVCATCGTGEQVAEPVKPRVVDAHAKVFSGLRNLGFREGQVRAVLTELLADEALRHAAPEQLLREVLIRIR